MDLKETTAFSPGLSNPLAGRTYSTFSILVLIWVRRGYFEEEGVALVGVCDDEFACLRLGREVDHFGGEAEIGYGAVWLLLMRHCDFKYGGYRMMRFFNK